MDNSRGVDKAAWVVGLIRILLWDTSDKGEHIFISSMSMFTQLQHDKSRREVQDSVITELADFLYGKVLEKVPEGLSWLSSSMTSVYATIWTLMHLIVEVTQSKLIMKFLILQYAIRPFTISSERMPSNKPNGSNSLS